MNPALDVAFILTDPDLASSFDVIRRTETVGTNGRGTLTTKTAHCAIGVITMASGNTLERAAAYQVMGRVISVVTQFELQGEVTGRQPDLVYWMGSYYIVKECDIYGHFGQGFYEAICVSTNYTDPDFKQELC